MGYIRVSSEEQVTGGVSMEAQDEAIRAYCALRGLELVAVVQDPGVSAGRPLVQRPGGLEVSNQVERGNVGAVVAWKLDRLFRDAADCLNTTRVWDHEGVSLHLIDLGGQAIDTTSAMGRFFLTVMAAGAEMERNLVSERTRFALASKRGRGERVGRVPFGMRLAEDGEHLEPDPDEQETIRVACTLQAEGASQRAIADALNAQGRLARGRLGQKTRWQQPMVCGLLRRQVA